jgi:hypothetical protein
MKVFMKTGAWSHFYSQWFAAVIYREMNRGFEKCIMIHRDLRRPTCTAFSNLSKKKPATFLFGMCPHDRLSVHCLCSASHMLADILDEFFARDASSNGFVVKLCYAQSPALLLIQSGGTRWRSWLKHRAISRKVASSIPDGVIGVFIEIILPAALWPWCWLSL